jgi:hypothetical protein
MILSSNDFVDPLVLAVAPTCNFLQELARICRIRFQSAINTSEVAPNSWGKTQIEKSKLLTPT